MGFLTVYSVSALCELWRCTVCKVDNYPVDLILTPSQSIVIRNIESKDRNAVESLLREHKIKMIDEVMEDRVRGPLVPTSCRILKCSVRAAACSQSDCRALLPPERRFAGMAPAAAGDARLVQIRNSLDLQATQIGKAIFSVF